MYRKVDGISKKVDGKRWYESRCVGTDSNEGKLPYEPMDLRNEELWNKEKGKF